MEDKRLFSRKKVYWETLAVLTGGILVSVHFLVLAATQDMKSTVLSLAFNVCASCLAVAIMCTAYDLFDGFRIKSHIKLSAIDLIIYVSAIIGCISCTAEFTDVTVTVFSEYSKLTVHEGMSLIGTSFGCCLFVMYMAAGIAVLTQKNGLLRVVLGCIIVGMHYQLKMAQVTAGLNHLSIGAYLMIASTIAMVAGNSMQEVFNIRKRQLKTEEKKEI